MEEFTALVLIAIGLSMDAFSLSLSFGTLDFKNKNALKISVIVGLFHFIMPLIGLFIGSKITNLLNINTNFVIGVILIFISLEMIIELKRKTKKQLGTKMIEILLFSLSVSLDSFSVGIGLNGITNNYILASTTFAIISFGFTYLGLILGKYSLKLLGNLARVLGIILLMIIGIVNLCKI